MKILYIDPWCANGSNLYYYSTGLVNAISKVADITLVCCSNFDLPRDNNYKINKVFFPRSNQMTSGTLRLVVRGLEYIFAYNKILDLAKAGNYDIIHIEWPLLYQIDKFYYSKLKKYCKVLSLKAHNILPHSTQDKYKDVFREIYSIADLVLVHGENMKKEFAKYFPEMTEKVRIQHHGVYLNFNKQYRLSDIEPKFVEKVNGFNRIYLFCGRIDYDKGIDRLTNIWKEHFQYKDSLLIIAGKVDSTVDFASIKDKLSNLNNVLIYEGYVPDNLLNYFMTSCNLVILPYRSGSMSGVVFTASEFSKPCLSTEFGVISEYLINDENSFVIGNTDEQLKTQLLCIDSTISNEKLTQMGANLNKYVVNAFSWENIGEKLVNETYASALKHF